MGEREKDTERERCLKSNAQEMKNKTINAFLRPEGQETAKQLAVPYIRPKLVLCLKYLNRLS